LFQSPTPVQGIDEVKLFFFYLYFERVKRGFPFWPEVCLLLMIANQCVFFFVMQADLSQTDVTFHVTGDVTDVAPARK
jgi:hypothetical protein